MLLHVCCGPCLIGAISRLLSMDENERKSTNIDITIDNISEKLKLFYFNPNIDSYEEYEKRLFEVDKVAKYYDLELIYDDKQDYLLHKKKWLTYVSEFKDVVEGGKRCSLCMKYRLLETANLAKEMKEFFSTTLSISPFKSTEQIFSIGKVLDNFLFINFKKKEGYNLSVKLSKDFGMYRQNYCGCGFFKRST